MMKFEENKPIAFPNLSLEAHRGGRGLYPENSILAMKMAIANPKVTTLEMDCLITKDNQVVVYHDHYLNPKFVLNPDGTALAPRDKSKLIYSYTYEDLALFDIGTKYYQDFPQQQKTKTSISTLHELIKNTELQAAKLSRTAMFYNIETKSIAGKDGIYQPKPQEFVHLLMQVIRQHKIEERTVIQSFDRRTIQYLHKNYPEIKTSYLISNQVRLSISQLLKRLGFTPFIISPDARIVNENFVKEAHTLGLKVIPWTINTKAEMEILKNLGVDGMISDYPNLF